MWKSLSLSHTWHQNAYQTSRQTLITIGARRNDALIIGSHLSLFIFICALFSTSHLISLYLLSSRRLRRDNYLFNRPCLLFRWFFGRRHLSFPVVGCPSFLLFSSATRFWTKRDRQFAKNAVAVLSFLNSMMHAVEDRGHFNGGKPAEVYGSSRKPSCITRLNSCVFVFISVLMMVT